MNVSISLNQVWASSVLSKILFQLCHLGCSNLNLLYKTLLRLAVATGSSPNNLQCCWMLMDFFFLKPYHPKKPTNHKKKKTPTTKDPNKQTKKPQQQQKPYTKTPPQTKKPKDIFILLRQKWVFGQSLLNGKNTQKTPKPLLIQYSQELDVYDHASLTFHLYYHLDQKFQIGPIKLQGAHSQRGLIKKIFFNVCKGWESFQIFSGSVSLHHVK